MAIVKSKLLKQLSNNYPNFLKKDLEKFSNIILIEIKRALARIRVYINPPCKKYYTFMNSGLMLFSPVFVDMNNKWKFCFFRYGSSCTALVNIKELLSKAADWVYNVAENDTNMDIGGYAEALNQKELILNPIGSSSMKWSGLVCISSHRIWYFLLKFRANKLIAWIWPDKHLLKNW